MIGFNTFLEKEGINPAEVKLVRHQDSHPTAHRYLNLLETGCMITRLRPLATNPTAALVKAPKLLWTDCGLAAWLAGIRSSADVAARMDSGFWLEHPVRQGGARDLEPSPVVTKH